MSEGMRKGAWVRVAVLLALGGGVAALCVLVPTSNTTPQAGVVMDLPEQVGGFRGKEVAATMGELATLPKDTQITRREYVDAGGDRILASIVLSGGRREVFIGLRCVCRRRDGRCGGGEWRRSIWRMGGIWR